MSLLKYTKSRKKFIETYLEMNQFSGLFYLTKTVVSFKKKIGAGKTTQWLRALTALEDDLCSVPSTHRVAHNCG